jgi:hypothetical protein
MSDRADDRASAPAGAIARPVTLALPAVCAAFARPLALTLSIPAVCAAIALFAAVPAIAAPDAAAGHSASATAQQATARAAPGTTRATQATAPAAHATPRAAPGTTRTTQGMTPAAHATTPAAHATTRHPSGSHALPSGSAPAPPSTPAATAGGQAQGATGPSAVVPGAAVADPDAQASSLPGDGPLVSNGLGSPSCAGAAALGRLSAGGRTNCEASGDVAAPAPLDNYQFDIHIDLPTFGVVSGLANEFDTLVQDGVLTPLWMALVWITDVLLVAIEWCYSINLLGGGTLAPIARGLDQMHRALTTPWLATVLAIAAVSFLYNGLIRRRVVDTLGQFALMLAMMVVGLWVIIDPADTVGAVSQLANQASLGVLSAAATGDPSQPSRGLADSLGQVFETAVGTPWCYLEFGDVDWCDNPARLDPQLRATATRIVAADELTSSAQTSAWRKESAAITAAQTNGALFLAFPTNGPSRNSIHASASSPSLLHTMCGSDDATSCPAQTGPEAEFRTQQGTFARVGGLLLITIGELGMFGFLGFIALRLLSAALLAALYLLLAPLAVLAPALGDGGRAVFRLWSQRLLGSVLAKLVYSVFLGVVLLMLRILGELGSLGWWTQWLLIGSFWWIVFNHRHRLLEHVIHERGESTRRASLGSRLFAAHQAMRLAGPVAKQVRRLAGAAVDVGRRVPTRPPSHGRGRDRHGADHTGDLAGQVSRTLEHDHRTAVSTVAVAPAREAESTAMRERRELLRREQRKATLDGDHRRAASLRLRADGVDAHIKAGEQELLGARTTVRRGEENMRHAGVVHDADQRRRQGAFLDRQADLRPLLAARRDKRRGRREYAELAPLAGLSRTDYAGLGGTQRRRAQLEIDRALERRRDWAEQTRIHEREQAIAARRSKTPSEKPPDRPKPARVDDRHRQFNVGDDRRPTGDGAAGDGRHRGDARGPVRGRAGGAAPAPRRPGSREGRSTAAQAGSAEPGPGSGDSGRRG